MAKKSPLEIVKEQHGSKADLAKKVVAILECPEDEDAASFEHRVQTMSNKKLLRLLKAHNAMQEKFGSKDKLVDAIVKSRFTNGNADYATKLATFTTPKLMDMARQQKLLK